MPLSSLSALAAALPWFYPAVAFVLGAAFGSFLNVIIHRVPAGQSIVRPPSHCDCGAPIAWYDNIPIASWLARRGRARCCGRPFTIRYPAVELLTALLFLACWRLFPPAVAICGWIFLSCLVAATFIDLDHMMIPDSLTIGLGVAGVLLSFLVPGLHGDRSAGYALASLHSGIAGLQGLLIGSGLVLWIALIAGALLKKEAMGFGDVKFLGAIGAFCGWRGAVFALFGGAVVGTAALALFLLWRKILPLRSPEPKPGKPAATLPGFGSHVPFGPMLAAAAAIYFLALHGPVDAWFERFTALL